ncbi:MAG: dephospho-CoA kinase [Brevinema sp.]
MVVALFAPVGAGKSTVLKLFAAKGWTTIDQDTLTHQLLNTHALDIARLFGEEVLENGLPNRKKLGAKVFSDPSKLQMLEDFLYPLIHQKTHALINGNTLIEGANLYKVLNQYSIDKTLTIVVPINVLKNRLLARGHAQEWIDRVLAAQKPLFEAQPQADFSLDNSGTIENLHQNVDALMTMLTSL